MKTLNNFLIGIILLLTNSTKTMDEKTLQKRLDTVEKNCAIQSKVILALYKQEAINKKSNQYLINELETARKMLEDALSKQK